MRKLGLDDETIVRRSYERFNGKTIFEANSKEAVQNYLIDNYIASITAPLQYSESKKPLDATTDYLKDRVLKDIDELSGNTTEKETSQLYYGTPSFQNQTKDDLISGKLHLGVFALATSHHSLAQSVGLAFKSNVISAKYNLLSLSSIDSQRPNYWDKDIITYTSISDWLSAMVNAHVDVAKDPYINRLNVRTLTLPMTAMLLRAGKGESTFYFLAQPALVQAAKEYEKNSGFYGAKKISAIGQIRSTRDQLLKRAASLFGESSKEYTKINEAANLDLTPEDAKNIFDIDYLRGIMPKSNKPEWFIGQLKVLKAFEEMHPFAKALSELTTISQIDTKKYGNNFALQQNFLIKISNFLRNSAAFVSPSAVIKNTFLREKLRAALINPRNIFSNSLLRVSRDFETRRALLYARTVGYDSDRITDNVATAITRAMESNFKLKAISSYARANGVRATDLLYGDNSIPRRLIRIKRLIQSGIFPELLKSDGTFENALLDNIDPMLKTTPVDFVLPDFLVFKANKSSDGNVDDLVIRAWEELLTFDTEVEANKKEAEEIRRFARDLAIYAMYTSGDAFGKNNIFKYVPNSFRETSGYFDQIRQLEQDPSNYYNQLDDDNLIRNLWWNDEIVPQLDLYTTSYDEFGMETRSIRPNVSADYSVNGVNVPGLFTADFGEVKFLYTNKFEQPIFTPYVKLALGEKNDPRTTKLYKFVGYEQSETSNGKTILRPVYKLVTKKGLNYKGKVVTEVIGSENSLSVVSINNESFNVDLPSLNIIPLTSNLPDPDRYKSIFDPIGVINRIIFDEAVTSATDINTTTELAGMIAPGEEGNQILNETIQLAKKGLLVTNELGEFFTSEEKELISKATSGKNLFVKSASRRTDPVFFTENLINQLKDNAKLPFGDPNRFYVMEIWSKHDGLPMLDLINACIEYRVAPIMSFSISTLGGTAVEPGVMRYNDLLDRIERFIKDGKINPKTTTFRIDPLIPGFTKLEDVENVVNRAKQMGIYKIVTSVMQSYGSSEATSRPRRVVPTLIERIKYDWGKYYGYDSRNLVNFRAKKEYSKELGDFMKEMSAKYDIRIESCASNDMGLPEAACLDPIAIEAVTGVEVDKSLKDQTRPQCQCYGAHGDMLKYSDVCRSCCAYCYGAQQIFDERESYYDANGNLVDNYLTRTSRDIQQVESLSTMAERWSKKEGWSIEHFYAKVLPKIDQAWQIEFKLAPDQSVSANFKGEMKYDYEGDTRPGITATSTIEAIRNGERTATTRYEYQGKINYWKSAKVGDIIDWYKGDEHVKVIVTKPLTKLRSNNAIQQELPFNSAPETINSYAGTGENEYLNHSGGAVGSDSYWGEIGEKYGVRSNHYWYKNTTPLGNTEISEEDALEGQQKATIAARQMGRISPTHQIRDERIIRNWSQVKYSDAIFAVTTLLQVGDEMNYGKKALIVQGKGGTGYAIQMAINEGKPVYVYDQVRDQWYKNINGEWSKTDTPVLVSNFAGIGTRELNDNGRKAIEEVYKKTFESTMQPTIDNSNSNEYIFSSVRNTYTFSNGFSVTTPFKLNDQQERALAKLNEFIDKETEDSITLSGYAGTGKTTVISILDKYLKNRRISTAYLAPTHRSNAVTNKMNSSANASTIHSFLGISSNVDITSDTFDVSSIKFDNTEFSVEDSSDLIIVDESSMIPDDLADILIQFASRSGKQIIFVGDPAQLKPVNNHGRISKIFREDNGEVIELTKVERTGDNAILEEATRLREGKDLTYTSKLNSNGEGITYTNSRDELMSYIESNLKSAEFAADPLYFRILSATNKAVPGYNKRSREMLYGKDVARAERLVPGELLMGYENEEQDRKEKIYNSFDYKVVKFEKDSRVLTGLFGGKVNISGYLTTLKDLFNPGVNQEVFILDPNTSQDTLYEIADIIDSFYAQYRQLISSGRGRDAKKVYAALMKFKQSFATMVPLYGRNGNLVKAKSLDYGYAHTIHKSQGGTYNKVVVLGGTINSFADPQTKQQLKYVAITRAKERVMYSVPDNVKINNNITITETNPIITELDKAGEQRINECK